MKLELELEIHWNACMRAYVRDTYMTQATQNRHHTCTTGKFIIIATQTSIIHKIINCLIIYFADVAAAVVVAFVSVGIIIIFLLCLIVCLLYTE